MRTIEEAIAIIKRLFSAPLGSFPRGGVESALRVRLNIAPTSITLMSEHGLNVMLRRDASKWVVVYLEEKSTHESLEEAIFALVAPIIRDEINHRL
tara:strand:+ start:22 stop:309 length:288 start_codon:yes stop_codon:yes gene_type:complete